MHLTRVGMPSERCLREEHVAVEGYFEPATGARHEGGATDQRGPAAQELSRQTGGSIGVVSGDAVLDLENVPWVRRFGGHVRSLDTLGVGCRHNP